MATELVDALTLDELIARHGPLPVRRVAQLGLELLDTLEAAHAAGLPHLDLRPGCVLVTADGRARLAGIGLATLRTAPETEPPTSAFLAPEQVRGDPAGPPADLWSLGTILFLAVEGKTPFTGDGSDLTRAAILNEPPLTPGLAGPLAPALNALLTKPPGGRPSIPETRHLLQPFAGPPDPIKPLAGSPDALRPLGGSPDPLQPVGGSPRLPAAVDSGVAHPAHPVPGPPEGEVSGSREWEPTSFHSPGLHGNWGWWGVGDGAGPPAAGEAGLGGEAGSRAAGGSGVGQGPGRG